MLSKPENSSKAGRKPFDGIMMFKPLILQTLYNLSDDQIEYQIVDRFSVKHFLGLKSSDKVPNSNTVWNFKETLVKEEVIDTLFYRFHEALDDQYIFFKK